MNYVADNCRDSPTGTSADNKRAFNEARITGTHKNTDAY